MYVQDTAYVYVVINMGDSSEDGYVYGVYSTRDIAESKASKERIKILFSDRNGYVAVLKKRIQGPSHRNITLLIGKNRDLLSVNK